MVDSGLVVCAMTILLTIKCCYCVNLNQQYVTVLQYSTAQHSSLFMTYDCRKSRVIGIVQSKVYMRGHACVVMHSIYRQYVKNVKDRLFTC